MSQKRRGLLSQKEEAVSSSVEGQSLVELCGCLPLSSYSTHMLEAQKQPLNDHMVPTTPLLFERLSVLLADLFPRAEPVSLLLLHVSQLEHPHIAPQTATLRKRQRFHAAEGLLEQILANVNRAVRADDQMVIHEGVGAALLFPDVDQYGAEGILERVYQNICLLQAETVIPPLTRETDIVLGMGSYPEPGHSVDQMLANASQIARRLVLRPAIPSRLSHVRGALAAPPIWSSVPQTQTSPQEEDLKHNENSHPIGTHKPEASSSAHATHGHTGRRVQGVIPFMELPHEVPARLKHLIPYEEARRLRSVPVGRDHHCLTVAMAHPTNMEDVRELRELTGLTIFPVSCEEQALEALLSKRW